MVRIDNAATVKGQVDAGVKLSDPPDDCMKMEPDPIATPGVEARVLARQFKRAKDRQNARTARCLVTPDSWYRTYQRELAGVKPNA